MTRRDAVIFDLDGTLSDDRHRRHLLPAALSDDPDDYHDYHVRGIADPVNATVRLFAFFAGGFGVRIILLTRRPEKWRTATEAWLRKHGIGYDWLIMADDDETRSGAEWKASQIDGGVLDKYRVVAVFEDDLESRKVFRDRFWPCRFFTVDPDGHLG